jgi:hypothetical protein
MTNPIRILLIAGAIFGVTWLVTAQKANDSPESKSAIAQVPREDTLSTETPLSATESASTAIVLTAAEKQAVTEFEARIADYAALHSKLEASLSALPDKATPEQIDKHQRDMVALIQKARINAKPGEFFTPGMVTLAKEASTATVDGPDGDEIEASIMDENPGALLSVNVNDRYPEGVPVTTMPIELLDTLPKLGEKLEYRFLGKRLILLDTCCQIVLDVTPNVLP